MECGWRPKNISVEISKLNSLKNSIFVFLLLFPVSGGLNASNTGLMNQAPAKEDTLISLKGEYLAYSYDFNQIYGENVEFEFSSYSATCRHIKINVTPKIFYAFGEVIIEKGDEKFEGDEFLFDPQVKKGKLISYGEKIEVKEIEDEEKKIFSQKNEVPKELTLAKIQKSLIYFVGQTFYITTDFDVYGYNVTLFVEGLESVKFKKLRLSSGIGKRRNGISLNRIWYTKSQGLIGKVSYFYEKEKKVNSLTQLNYEEHSVLKDYTGLKRQVDVISSTTINIKDDLDLGLTGNYNSSNLWNTLIWLNKNWSKKFSTQVNFSYNKPINLKGEAWFGLQSTINTGKFGNISFSGKYEIQNQMLTNFSYGNIFFKKINFLLSSSYSQVKIGESPDHSKILSGGVNLSYSSRIFNVSTDYFLNHDLFGDQLLSQPQLRLGFNPFQFYGGLISANIYNIFIYNNLKRGGAEEESYSNNTVLTLSTQPVFLQKGLSLNYNLSLEQFVEKEGRNFTSGGFIFNLNKSIVKGVSLEGLYSFQSRRKTKDWLIEGTTSQDLSAVLKANLSKRLNGWVSFSYDPKNSQWRQSFADISVGIIRYWKLHSLIHYDFLLEKINNVDLYLIRDAGRFQLRFIWRSLSKQFLIELVPR
jgi:hypothetical protein